MSGDKAVAHNTLAVCGSNLSGDVPFSAALQLADGTRHVRTSPAGERGDLTTLCDALCKEAGLAIADIQRVLIDVGPGSYTGLRVAVTFVRFAQAFGEVAVERACSLEMLARHALQATGKTSGRIRTVLDARRGRYHTALFGLEPDGSLRELEAAAAVPPEDALRDLDGNDLAVMPQNLADKIGAQVQERCTLHIASQVCADILFSSSCEPSRAEDLEPRYLMASYAED